MKNTKAYTHQIKSEQDLCQFRSKTTWAWALGSVVGLEPFNVVCVEHGLSITNARFGRTFLDCSITVRDMNIINEFMIQTEETKQVEHDPCSGIEELAAILHKKIYRKITANEYKLNAQALLLSFNEKTSIQFVKSKNPEEPVPAVVVHGGELFRADLFTETQRSELYRAFMDLESIKAKALIEKLSFIQNLDL